MVRIREKPEFASLMACNRSSLPRCLAWHGWLPMLTARRVEPSWAVAVGDGVDASLEVASGAFPLDPGGAWNPGRNPEDVVFSFS